ncbi:MAG TPA: PhzF family phenazine biosynthesis protein [Pirellulales bacterium]|nr:PhzF family phenazine biosynthesis protein [Pirellulales bacterium]
MAIPVFQVDAFTNRVFGGNPAAICPLDEWLPDATLQAIAAEHNLSETAYLRRSSPGVYDLRWFTPAVEVDLCGHATLASALVVFDHLEPWLNEVGFDTRSGRLLVRRADGRLLMDFPSRKPVPCEEPVFLIEGLGLRPQQVLKASDYVAVYATEEEVRSLEPDMRLLKELPSRGVIVTAPGREVDFVSRFFAPQSGIDEDPVTGSAHSTLIPYWSERLQKSQLHALQVSRRQGELWCADRGERVEISGQAVLYSRGTILI